MNENENKNAVWERYNRTTHTMGRISSIITLVLLIGAPFLIGGYLGAFPDISAAAKGFLSVGLVWMVSSIAEFLIYTPMLGAGGGYLAFITGNLINMKIPCAVNARDMVGAKTGTKENEIISTIAVSTSAIVTTLVIAVGVLAITPLTPLLENPVLTPAFKTVVYALFGAMGWTYLTKYPVIAIVPWVLGAVLFFLIPALTGSVSIMVVVLAVIAMAYGQVLYRRKKV